MKYVGIAAIGVLVLGLGTVNIQHHLNVPDEAKSSASIHKSHFWNLDVPFIHERTDIQLADEIKGLDTVRLIDQELQQAKKGDKVVFHLAGYGGQLGAVYSMINNIQSTEADVEMDVEGPVYSGHAYLALSGKSLKIGNNAFIMLHSPADGDNNALKDTDCSKFTGFDRGVSKVEHCERMKTADMLLFTRMLMSLSYLTVQEVVDIYTGHSVYIDSSDINKRIKAGNHA